MKLEASWSLSQIKYAFRFLSEKFKKLIDRTGSG